MKYIFRQVLIFLKVWGKWKTFPKFHWVTEETEFEEAFLSIAMNTLKNKVQYFGLRIW